MPKPRGFALFWAWNSTTRCTPLPPAPSAQNIDTPSSAQVARGLSDAGVAQWRRYGPQLEPVFPVLAPFVARFGYPEN